MHNTKFNNYGKSKAETPKRSGSYLAPLRLCLSTLGTNLGCKFARSYKKKGNFCIIVFINRRHRFTHRIFLKLSLNKSCPLYSRKYFQVQF